MGSDLLERVVDGLHVDVGADPGFASNGLVSDEVTNHMPGAVLEARIRSVRIHAPAEDALVEGGRLLWLLRGDAQIGDPGGPEKTWDSPSAAGGRAAL